MAGILGENYGANCAAPTRPLNVYEEHAAATKEWHEACHAFRQVEERRSFARKQLEEATKRLGEHIQAIDADPTTAPQMQERSYIGR